MNEFSPCIMCVQYIGGCSVHRGDTMSTSGGYHEYIGGYHEYIGGCLIKLVRTCLEDKN